MSKQSILMVLSVVVLGACGGGSRPVLTDSGTGGTDSGTPVGDSGGPRDSGGARDTGGSSDPCATDQAAALSTLGCNGGYISTAPAANQELGACTPDADPMANPAGSCTVANAICAADAGATAGICIVGCPAAATYISTGGCATGSRCFTLGTAPDEYGICFRDCDASHACPTGFMCDGEGSCVQM